MLHSNNTFRRGLLRSVLLLGVFLVSVQGACADTTGDKRRAQMATVKRIAVVPLFFGTDTLRKFRPPDKQEGKPDTGASPGNSSAKPANGSDPRLQEYVQHLQKLEDHARARLPERVMARTPFQVVPAEEMNQAFKDLKLTPQKLFQNNGLMRGARFALPDSQAVHTLAARLHADAVLLGTLDEPRRSNGHYYFDPLDGINYTSAHVQSKAGFFVLLADGTEVLHDYIEVLHPLTRIGSQEFVLADWVDVEDQVIENLMDEWTRYTPAKS